MYAEPDERSREHNRFSASDVIARREPNNSYKTRRNSLFFHEILGAKLRNHEKWRITISPFSIPRIILVRILDQIVETFLNYALGIWKLFISVENFTVRPIYVTKKLGKRSRKSGSDRIILAVFTCNNLPRVRQTVGLTENQVWNVAFRPLLLGTWPIFDMRLQYCACDLWVYGPRAHSRVKGNGEEWDFFIARFFHDTPNKRTCSQASEVITQNDVRIK